MITMGQQQAPILIFCVNQRLLLFYFWRFGRIRFRALGLVFALNLKLLELPDLIVGLTQAMPISDVNIDPPSSVPYSHSTRPH